MEKLKKIKKGGLGGIFPKKPTGPGFPPRGPPRRVPPRPGFPPIVRPQISSRRPRPAYREDPAMKETFRKLRTIASR